MGRQSLPKKYLQYSKFGQRIGNTFFVAFRVPLGEDLNQRVEPEQRMTIEDVVNQYPTLGLVIDLTNTDRYYNNKEWSQQSVAYRKIALNGHGSLPHTKDIRRFYGVVEKYRNTSPDQLIGIHCTHGVNRTGLMICCFLIEKMGLNSQTAIDLFEQNRGHKFDRQIYVDYLLERKPNVVSMQDSSNNLMNRNTSAILSATPATSSSSSFNPRQKLNKKRSSTGSFQYCKLMNQTEFLSNNWRDRSNSINNSRDCDQMQKDTLTFSSSSRQMFQRQRSREVREDSLGIESMSISESGTKPSKHGEQLNFSPDNWRTF